MQPEVINKMPEDKMSTLPARKAYQLSKIEKYKALHGEDTFESKGILTLSLPESINYTEPCTFNSIDYPHLSNIQDTLVESLGLHFSLEQDSNSVC